MLHLHHRRLATRPENGLLAAQPDVPASLARSSLEGRTALGHRVRKQASILISAIPLKLIPYLVRQHSVATPRRHAPPPAPNSASQSNTFAKIELETKAAFVLPLGIITKPQRRNYKSHACYSTILALPPI